MKVVALVKIPTQASEKAVPLAVPVVVVAVIVDQDCLEAYHTLNHKLVT